MKGSAGTRPILAAGLFVFSVLLGGSSLFIATEPSHPVLAWLLIGALLVLAVVVWFVLSKFNRTHIFDAEIYRIVTGSKGAFAIETQQLIESLGRDFAIDVDVLVELYIVNISTKTQYVRDIYASVEIDGVRIPMLRQKDFYAWDLNGTDYEYCLDPTPKENKLLVSSRAEGLNLLAPTFPAALEARRPLEGWVHFLLKDVNPKKLENNQTYQFSMVDSIGEEHPISRPAGKPRTSEIAVRAVRVVR